jgi:predicted dehydrogenase
MEADQIGESVARSENILEVVRSVMYQPVVLRAKELISSGRLGDVIHMNVEWLHTPKEPMAINSKHWTHNIPGGKLAETIPHLIVLAHNFLGNSEVIKVLPTKIGSYSWMRSDELNLLFKNGEKTASAYLSFNAPVELLTITLFCQKEVIKIDLNSQTLNKIGLHPKSDNRFSRFYSLIGNNFEAMGEILKISLKKALNQEDTPFYNQARRFLEAIELNNKTEYSWDKCYNEIKLQEIIALLI